MPAQKNRNQGFTLVEILIVVVILGILAAIVIPQFTSASESARASSLTSQLQTIRSQLELYQVQHNGNYPAQMKDDNGPSWEEMTKEKNGFGPYLQQFPTNPFRSDKTAVEQWNYDPDGGTIKAVLDDIDQAKDAGLVDASESDFSNSPDFTDTAGTGGGGS